MVAAIKGALAENAIHPNVAGLGQSESNGHSQSPGGRLLTYPSNGPAKYIAPSLGRQFGDVMVLAACGRIPAI